MKTITPAFTTQKKTFFNLITQWNECMRVYKAITIEIDSIPMAQSHAFAQYMHDIMAYARNDLQSLFQETRIYEMPDNMSKILKRFDIEHQKSLTLEPDMTVDDVCQQLFGMNQAAVIGTFEDISLGLKSLHTNISDDKKRKILSLLQEQYSMLDASLFQIRQTMNPKIQHHMDSTAVVTNNAIALIETNITPFRMMPKNIADLQGAASEILVWLEVLSELTPLNPLRAQEDDIRSFFLLTLEPNYFENLLMPLYTTLSKVLQIKVNTTNDPCTKLRASMQELFFTLRALHETLYHAVLSHEGRENTSFEFVQKYEKRVEEIQKYLKFISLQIPEIGNLYGHQIHIPLSKKTFAPPEKATLQDAWDDIGFIIAMNAPL